MINNNSKFWYLRHFNIFEGLDEETVSFVDKNTAMCIFKKNESIYFPADIRKYVYFLKKGHVKISRYSHDGKELILDVLGPGEVFGELSLTDTNDDNDEIAQAMDEVLICSVHHRDFETILRKYPELNFRITKQMGIRLKKIEQRITDLAFKDVRKRLISFLLHYAESFGKTRSGIVTIRPALSHQEIGFLTGSARQTVTSILNELRDTGLIEFNRKEIIIKDMPALHKMTE